MNYQCNIEKENAFKKTKHSVRIYDWNSHSQPQLVVSIKHLSYLLGKSKTNKFQFLHRCRPTSSIQKTVSQVLETKSNKNIATMTLHAITFTIWKSFRNYPTTINIKYDYKHLPFLNWLKNWLKANKRILHSRAQTSRDVLLAIRWKVTTWVSSI